MASAAIPACSTGRGCAMRTASTANVDALTAELGTGSVYAQMTLKPFCTAKQALAAIEALMRFARRRRPAERRIDKVRVRVPPPYARMIAMKAEAGVRSSTIVSAAFQMGLAASIATDSMTSSAPT